MAKYDLKFLDYEETGSYIQANEQNNTIWISGFYTNAVLINEGEREVPAEFIIALDKSTAIKFAKTLRTEINKIKEVENGNR